MTRAQLGRPVGASGVETRQRIIAAAMRCVSQVGYSRATIREIARTANVTSASLYNYFPNKSELIKATIAARADIAMPRLRKAAEGSGGIVERIEAVLDECGELIREYPDLASFEFAIRAENVVDLDGPESSREPAAYGFRAFREIIVGMVDDAQRRGELTEQANPQGAIEAIYALIYGLTELAATVPPADFHAALRCAKGLVNGTLFQRS
ncbi:TetR/AcrR family transcriptional regulator [Mycobacterium spongiae]|uniref:TetR family transcriptional regulator n=1 Tax=Mycobacterium spongiae TaxID=886343 RepID=A0A975JUE6_9MYCO|nr:TetR/AcrR family transcriptional regulator [Mycobacterium spongiae]QUR65841.1 TetR family transcriptional regulator [Mycobacterium spongiae]